ncbi:MAG: hypothetical protein WBG49_05845, partial [Thermoanaerobaculia bacterium]
VVAVLEDMEDLSVLCAEEGMAEEAVTIACEMGEDELGSGPAVIAEVVFGFGDEAMELVLEAFQVGFHAETVAPLDCGQKECFRLAGIGLEAQDLTQLVEEMPALSELMDDVASVAIFVETVGDAVELFDRGRDSWVPGPGDPLLGLRGGGLEAVEELEVRQAERETRRLTPVAVKDPVEQGGELVVVVTLRACGVLPVFDFQRAQQTAHLLADASDLQVSLEAVVAAPHQVSADVGDKMIVTD